MIQSTPMLAQRPDSGPAPVKLDPYDLHDTARKFIEAQKTCSSIMNDLHNKLWDNGAAFGGSRSVDQFNIVYGTECNIPGAAPAVFAGFVAAHRLLGNIGKGLEVSAQNHHAADHASTPPGQATATPPQQLEPEPDIRQLDVPDIKGAARPSWLQEQWDWPVCDKGKADAIAGAYNDAHKSLTNLVSGLHSGLQALLSNNDSEDLWELDDFWRRVADDSNDNTFLTAFPNLVQKVGAAVSDYANKIEQHHGDFVNALKDAEEKNHLFRNFWNEHIGPIYGPDAKNLGLPSGTLGCEDWFFLDLDKATTNLGATEKNFETAMSAPGPIKDVENAAHAFGDVLTSLPQPNVETAAATQLGDTLLGSQHDAGPRHTGGVAGPATGPATGAAVGVAGYPRPSVAKPGAGTTEPGTGTTGGNVAGKDGSRTDVSGGVNPPLDQAGAQLSSDDWQRFEQLLAHAKSPQEQEYLLKTLVAGHSVDEITSFGNLIHNHGDDPAWLQQHLTPMPNGDPQHPDFTYLGGSWTQGQYPASLAASAIVARATADPAYALQLTTGDKPDDPNSTTKEAFLQRLHDEQQSVYDHGLSGGDDNPGVSQTSGDHHDDTEGGYTGEGQQIVNKNIGTYNLE